MAVLLMEFLSKGEFSVARSGWIADWNDSSVMLSLFRSNSGNNDCNYNNPEFDRYMTESYRNDFGQVYKAAIEIITIPQSQSEVKSILADGMDKNDITAYFRDPEKRATHSIARQALGAIRI